MPDSPPEHAGLRPQQQPADRRPVAFERRSALHADAGPAQPLGGNPRSVDAIEQRYLDTQQGLEHGYWAHRQALSHARLLADVARDALLLLDAQTLAVLEANPAALALFDCSATALFGQPLTTCVATTLRPALDTLLRGAAASGHAAEVRLALGTAADGIALLASPTLAGRQRCLVLRCRRLDVGLPVGASPADDDDAAVIIGSQGRVLWANAPLLALCGADHAGAVEGRLLADVLGGPPAQWSALLAQVAERRVVGRAALSLRGPGAAGRPALFSAAVLFETEAEQIGCTLRLLDLAAPAPCTVEHT